MRYRSEGSGAGTPPEADDGDADEVLAFPSAADDDAAAREARAGNASALLSCDSGSSCDMASGVGGMRRVQRGQVCAEPLVAPKSRAPSPRLSGQSSRASLSLSPVRARMPL